jgi:type IV secretory pathway VirD2 relaxase
VSYAPTGKGGRWRAHGHYLSRAGAQREGARGLGFDAKEQEVYLPDRLDAWQKAGDQQLWKIVVSPEAGSRVDLQGHARELVAWMEEDLGTRLEWAAIDHHDTDHPHMHIAIRGVDDGGHPLWIPREYVRSGIRGRSQELLTRALGPRLDADRRRARERAVAAPRLTEIDRTLRLRATPTGVVSLEGPTPAQPWAQERRAQGLRRLAYLGELGLAKRLDERAWRLSPDLEAGLRQIQVSGDILKSMAASGVGITDRHAPVVLARLEPGAELRGRVAGAGLNEATDEPFLIIEGTDGRRHVVPQTPAMHRARGAGRLRPGEIVTLRATGMTGAAAIQIVEHGSLRSLRHVEVASTPLDLDALVSVRETGRLPVQASGREGFLRRWWGAVIARGPLLERSGLIRRIESAREREIFEIKPGVEHMVEARMLQRGRTPLSFEELEKGQSKPLRVATSTPGRVHRGRLIAYAEDASGARHAILDTGRELTAIPADGETAEIGHDVRARALLAQEEDREQRRVRWALDDLERSRVRDRSR